MALDAEVTQSGARLNGCVAILRERRASWREIGEALGISRQAAWQRFHGSVDERTGGAKALRSTRDGPGS